MAKQSISTAGKLAIALALIGGLLALSRAIYNYAQHGNMDIGKIALGIGIPCLIYAIVRSTTPEK